MHKFSRDFFSGFLSVSIFKLVLAFILFFTSGLLISKMPGYLSERISTSKVFAGFLTLLPQVVAILIYTLFLYYLMQKKIEECGLFEGICIRTAVALLIFLALVFGSTAIKTFLCKAFKENTVNAIIFSFISGLIFVTLESFAKESRKAFVYMLFGIPISTIIMTFITKGITSLLAKVEARSGGEIMGNAFLWEFALLTAILLSFLYDKYFYRIKEMFKKEVDNLES